MTPQTNGATTVTAPPLAPAPSNADGSIPRILCVDDEPALLAVISDLHMPQLDGARFLRL